MKDSCKLDSDSQVFFLTNWMEAGTDLHFFKLPQGFVSFPGGG
jgi:hypothetical protein